jgi:glutamate formiminotransferase/glutamate formiminotransferase/formiminotetrahydrofolate cyclodeaminase
VITFVCAPESVVDGAVRGVAKAAELIDMRTHRGEHPRLGATDVLPFVPIQQVTMEECVRLAHEAGERIAAELAIPVYFYEQAARLPNRKNLEDVRRGALELLREQIVTHSDRAPDVGSPNVHETAGAIVIGARPILIAFNVVLRSTDIRVARQIARTIRARNGGLACLKALAFQLHSKGLVQVSMNLIDYRVTGMTEAFAAVKREADKMGVGVSTVEIVGLVPREALDENAEYFARLENFSEARILENQIAKCSQS